MYYWQSELCKLMQSYIFIIGIYQGLHVYILFVLFSRWVINHRPKRDAFKNNLKCEALKSGPGQKLVTDTGDTDTHTGSCLELLRKKFLVNDILRYIQL